MTENRLYQIVRDLGPVLITGCSVAAGVVQFTRAQRPVPVFKLNVAPKASDKPYVALQNYGKGVLQIKKLEYWIGEDGKHASDPLQALKHAGVSRGVLSKLICHAKYPPTAVQRFSLEPLLTQDPQDELTEQEAAELKDALVKIHMQVVYESAFGVFDDKHVDFLAKLPPEP